MTLVKKILIIFWVHRKQHMHWCSPFSPQCTQYPPTQTGSDSLCQLHGSYSELRSESNRGSWLPEDKASTNRNHKILLASIFFKKEKIKISQEHRKFKTCQSESSTLLHTVLICNHLNCFSLVFALWHYRSAGKRPLLTN